MSYSPKIVLGLGGMGSATLYHLSQRGVEPMGIEQFQTGHSKGSSYGHSRVFRSLYEKPQYIDMTQKSYELWRQLERHSGHHLLTLNGMLFFARPDNKPLQDNMAIYRESGMPCEDLSPEEAARRHPALSLPGNSTVFYTPMAGFLNASQCVETHVGLASSSGATVFQECPVTQIDISGDQPVVVTEDGTWKCDRLVVTAGPWTSQLFASIGLPLTVTRQQKFYFEGSGKADLLPGKLPVFADYDTDFYGFPWHVKGIKAADDIDGAPVNPDCPDRSLNMSTARELEAWVNQIMPGRQFRYTTGETCMYTVTPDRDFMIGRHPSNPNVIIGAGFSGHGFKFSSLVGRTLAQLALDDEANIPLEMFDPGRFTGIQEPTS